MASARPEAEEKVAAAKIRDLEMHGRVELQVVEPVRKRDGRRRY